MGKLLIKNGYIVSMNEKERFLMEVLFLLKMIE